MGRIIVVGLIVLFLLAPFAGEAKPWAWVWYPGEYDKPPGKYYGRLTFTLDDEVTAAYAFVTGDNFTTLYLNGQRIGGSGDWYTLKPVTIETMAPLLQQGKNVLAAHVQNDDYEGGFVLKGLILLADGRRVVLNSNDDWLCTNTPVEGWEQINFDDSAWVPSEVIGTPPAGPWGSPTLPPSRHLIGTLDVDDPVAKKQFNYSGEGASVTNAADYPDGTTVRDAGLVVAERETFTVKLSSAGYLVLERRLLGGLAGDVRVAVDGRDAGLWHSTPPETRAWSSAFFVVPYPMTVGKPQVAITLTPATPGAYAAYRYDFMTTFEWYMFDADATGSLDRVALAAEVKANPNDVSAAFRYAFALEGERRWPEAQQAYERCVTLAAASDLGDSAYRGACLARGMQALNASRGNAAKLYEVGLYLKLHGFYDEAAEALRASIVARPTADAYDQLGEAMLFGGRPIAECLEVWKTGLTRFPPKDTNAWSCIIALRPSPEQEELVPAQKEQLQTFIDMVYAASRGRMALHGRMLVNPPPRHELFGEGELDTLITVAGGAAGGSTLGPDVTYGHSGWSGFGFVTVWDVAWHEWIHQLECGLASSRNGTGWGGCHSSTHFGYRPPWWNWYWAAMRYYVRPGQYQRVCLSDHVNVPYADKWLVKGPFASPDIAPAWICYPGTRDAAKFAWDARKTFRLETLPTEAKLVATGDDLVIAWVNGRRVIAHGSWMSAPTADVTKHLRAGENVIAVAGLNDTFSGAVLGQLSMMFAGGTYRDLATDESWKTAESTEEAFRAQYDDESAAAPDWTKPGFDDATWKACELVGRYPCAPWNVIRAELPDRLMKTDFAGPSAAAPSAADGWKPVELQNKIFKLSEVTPPENDAHQTLTYAFTYVHAPADMRAQMSVGSHRRSVVRLNGEELGTYGGFGYPTLPAVFPVELKKGWNRLLVRAEDIAQQSLFWVKIYRPDGTPIEGLKYSNVRPSSGIVADQSTKPSFDPARPKLYRWADVAEDPYTLMPQLTADDLAKLTGYTGLTMRGGNNYLFIDLNAQQISEGSSAIVNYAGGERDLNNALTWDFEPLAVVRYVEGGKTHDLIFVKPDALELVFQTSLLKKASGSAPPSGRLLGWVLEGGRLAVVAEANLGTPPAQTLDLFAAK